MTDIKFTQKFIGLFQRYTLVPRCKKIKNKMCWNVLCPIVPSAFCPNCRSWYNCSSELLSSGWIWSGRHAGRRNYERCKMILLHDWPCCSFCIFSSNLCNLQSLIAVKIPHLGGFVTRGSEDLTPILVKREARRKRFRGRESTGLKPLCGTRLTSLQHASSTGPVCICWALGTVCPLSWTSQHRT